MSGLPAASQVEKYRHLVRRELSVRGGQRTVGRSQRPLGVEKRQEIDFAAAV